MDKRILFLTSDVSIYTGAGIFTEAVRRVIKERGCLYNEFVFPSYSTGWKKLYSCLLGYTGKFVSNGMLVQYIRQNDIGIVFFNGSGYGRLVRNVKKNCPNVKCICLFHNIEFYFVRNAVQRLKHLSGILTLLATYLNERLSVRYSDTRICLNLRDSNGMFGLYGRHADVVCPLCLPDRFNEERLRESGDGELMGAFIGSNFYANRVGILWFAKNVAPYIRVKILVIGRSFENLREELESYSKNIEVIGTVDSLDDYYYKLDFVVSPIFDGSGMKTKTAEALMFGKTIFGTSEAFEGYKIENYGSIGALCNTAVEFIASINGFQRKANKFNIESRDLYLANYSDKTLESVLLNAIEYK